MANKSPTRRRRLRFSLRTLFVVMTLIAIAIVFWPKTPSVTDAYEAFAKAIENKQFQDAYQMLTPDYQKRYAYADFLGLYSACGPPDDPIAQVQTFKKLAVIECHAKGYAADIRSARYVWKLIDGKWYVDDIIYFEW
jgi:hypothetical protein